MEKKIKESQLASLSSERAVGQFINNEKENISKIIKQMLAVGEIFKCENLQVCSQPSVLYTLYFGFFGQL